MKKALRNWTVIVVLLSVALLSNSALPSIHSVVELQNEHSSLEQSTPGPSIAGVPETISPIPSANTVIATIPLSGIGGSPSGVAYDSRNGDVYVASYGSNDVDIINGTTPVGLTLD
jgi:hypothetical protein